MDINNLKAEVGSWPRNSRGQLVLSDSKKDLIRSSFASSGLTVSRFCAGTGLKSPTVSRLIRRAKKSANKKLKKQNLFQALKVVPAKEESSWEVCGPQGLQVKCKDLSQLAQLWRVLC